MMISVKFSKKQKVFLVGVEHTSNPKDPQFEAIDISFKDFLTCQGEMIAIIEGNAIPKRLIINDRDKLISSLGERGYVLHMLEDKKIHYVFSDPTISDEYYYLVEKFGKEPATYYLFIRTLGGLLRKRVDGDFDEMISYVINSLNEEILEIKLSKENVLLLNSVFSVHELTKNFFDEIVKCTYPDKRRKNPINKIACKSSAFRDEALSRAITNALLKEKNSIFVLFGEHHIKKISPMFKKWKRS